MLNVDIKGNIQLTTQQERPKVVYQTIPIFVNYTPQTRYNQAIAELQKTFKEIVDKY